MSYKAKRFRENKRLTKHGYDYGNAGMLAFELNEREPDKVYPLATPQARLQHCLDIEIESIQNKLSSRFPDVEKLAGTFIFDEGELMRTAIECQYQEDINCIGIYWDIASPGDLEMMQESEAAITHELAIMISGTDAGEKFRNTWKEMIDVLNEKRSAYGKIRIDWEEDIEEKYNI